MRILVGMSGGADSSFAALRLLDEGHEVEGAVLVMHDYTDTAAASLAAQEIGIPLHVVDCRAAFEEHVVEYFVNEYKKGRTPNPCTVCNGAVKFKMLYDYAMKNGFDRIATGHYARVGYENGRYSISRAEDLKKDQSYMLWRLSQDILARLVLPLWGIDKEEVRRTLADRGITSSKSPDSQEICFIPDDDYVSFIKNRTCDFEKGSFVDKDGNVLGKHEGIIGYTVGQRKGLGVSLGKRMFVTRIDPVKNEVVLSENPDTTDSVSVSDICFSGVSEVGAGEVVEGEVKLRYLARAIPAKAKFIDTKHATLTLDVPEKSVTPGQSAVFYRDKKLLFGGFID